MTISLVLAWIAVLLALLTAWKFFARVSGNHKLNHVFARCHVPFGYLLLATVVLHGLLAGNPSSATLTNFELAPALLSLNWGTAALVLTIGLAVTYLTRKHWSRHWLAAHRILTVAMLLCLLLHLCDTGIQLPGRLLGSANAAEAATSESANGTDAAKSSASASSGTTPVQQQPVAGSSAGTNGETAPSSGNSGASSAESPSGVASFSGAQLRDGTYQGSAEGYNGTITVSVTVSGGQVTAVDVVGQSETEGFFAQAESVLDTIVGQQSLEVDTVTGATFSSAGLINATANALQNAVVSGTLQVTDIDLSSVNRHGGHGDHG